MKCRAFPGEGPEVAQKYQRAGHWLRAALFGNAKSIDWCKANSLPIRKAAGESIGSAGALLVPEELSTAILDAREIYGAFRRSARIVPMASDETSVPKRPGGTGAFFFAENTAATASSVNVDKVALTAKKIGTLILMSTELEEDSLTDAVDFMVNEIAYAFAVKEDDCAFNGDGTSTYGGMRGIAQLVLDGNHAIAKVVAAASHNTFLTLDATDMSNLLGGVRASALPGAAWFISQMGFAQTMCRLSAAAGAYLDTGIVNGVPTPFFLGFPVMLAQKLPQVSTTLSGKAMLAFGDMYSAAVLGQRREITLAKTSDRYLDQDMIGILGTQRFDAVIHDAGDNTNAGSIAALVAP